MVEFSGFPSDRSGEVPNPFGDFTQPPLDIVRGADAVFPAPEEGDDALPIVPGANRRPFEPPAETTAGADTDTPAVTHEEAAVPRPSEPTEASPEYQALVGEQVAVTPGAAVSDPMSELKRTKLSVDCAEDAYRGTMDRFPGLNPEHQAHLHEQVKGIGDEDALRVFKYGLWVHDICKNKTVLTELNAEGMDHDQAFTRMVSDPQYAHVRQKYMPGFDDLPEWGRERLTAMAAIESNYAQTLQGEAPAETLEDIHTATDPDAVKWRVLEAKLDVFGAAGYVNQDVSLTATDPTYRRMRNLDAAPTDSSLPTAEARNNAFLDSEIRDLLGPVDDLAPEQLAELRALARLGCHLRVENQQEFAALKATYDAQPPIVKEVLATELNRKTRPTLAYYSPELMRTLTERFGPEEALGYFAHVLQEAHIIDSQARRDGLPGIATVQLDDLIRGLKQGEIDPTRQTIHFVEQEDGTVTAVPQQPTLTHLEGVPEFTEGAALTGKRVLLVGEGGGSDGVQAAMLGKLLSTAYGCEVAGVASIRSEEQDRSLANAGMQVGQATREVTPETTTVGGWRFLEQIPTEGSDPTRMFVLNSSQPDVITDEVRHLVGATGADVIIGVDTGGDSLYRTVHAGFSARNSADITPDNDYNAIQGLDRYAARHPDIPVLSAIVAPGVDSPPYAREMIDEIGARRMPLSDAQVEQVRTTYAAWRMDGSGSEEGRYGKTPLAWLHALQGNTGVQRLDLPRRNVTSETNPWRAFTIITPAMREILLADLQQHAQAIRRTPGTETQTT